MRPSHASAAARTRGLALVAVLWIVAALSLIVAGLLTSVRGETQAVFAGKQAVASAALGDAAILLTLQSLQAAGQTQWSQPETRQQRYAGQIFDVALSPANGWIDLNHAPAPLLERLFQTLGGASAAEAAGMAKAVITRRESGANPGAASLESVDDLASLPEIPFDVYARIKNAVTVQGAGSGGKVNPLAAPAPVLAVLAGGASARAVTDAASFDPQYTQSAADTRLRLAVTLAGWQRVWWVRFGESGPLPWRILERQTLPADD